MMTNTVLYNKISALPSNLQNELMDYMEFLISKYKEKKQTLHPKAGCMQGTFKMTSDFNEPIEDFNDYMK